jgi:general secretion pathway protein D
LLKYLNKLGSVLFISALMTLPLIYSPAIYAAEPAAQPAVAPKPPAPPPAVAPQPTAPPAQPRPVPPPPSRPAPSGGGSSFFFDDADVFEVIQTVFGEALRVNYIIDPAVKGRVNFRTTTPIPRDRILPIMEIILRLNGIGVVEEAGLYRIIPIGNISKEPAPIRFGKAPETVDLKGTAIMQIVPLTHISSNEMSAILTPLLTQGGAIHDISKRNILIIADTDANVRRLLQVVATFDTDPKLATNQPKIYVYSVQNSKAKNVSDILHHLLLGGAAPPSTASSASTSGVKTSTGISATTGTAAAPKAGPVAVPKPAGAAGGDTLVAATTKIYPDEANNTLVILATPADYSIILAAVKQIDIIPRQVMIEATVAALTMTDNLTLGLRWNASFKANALDISPLSSHPLTAALGTVGFQNLSGLSAGSFGYVLTDKGGNVKVAIETLAENNKAKILSSPHLLVSDNKEAKIQVGKQVPLATSSSTTPLTTSADKIVSTTTSTIQYKDVGTILTIKPQINDGGLVSLELSQEVSSAETSLVLGTEQYIINKSEVKTNLIVQDGQTIIIGGLVTENVNYARSAVPLLGKIPVLGYLFGHTADKMDRQELVIMITPRVIRNPEDAKKLTSDYTERFRNVEKEINIERHLKSFPGNNKPPTATPGAAAMPVQTAPTQAPAQQPTVILPAAPAPQQAPVKSAVSPPPPPPPAPKPAPVAAPAQSQTTAPKPATVPVQQKPVMLPAAPAPQQAPIKPAVQPPPPQPKPAAVSAPAAPQPVAPAPKPAAPATPAPLPEPQPAPAPK